MKFAPSRVSMFPDHPWPNELELFALGGNTRSKLQGVVFPDDGERNSSPSASHLSNAFQSEPGKLEN